MKIQNNAQCERFMGLFARQERVVRGFVRSLIPTVQEVDDVMQEVGMACWRKFDSFDPHGSSDEFARWACAIARFEVRRHRRKMAGDRIVLSEDVIEILATDAEERVSKAEAEQTAVKHCLRKLQDAERRLLLSVHTPDDSVVRIASELGQNARRLYSKVNALRVLLAECVRQNLAEGEA